jgi:16S rRNA (cytidine1402-2'-O)-methyltransferase
VIYESPQRVASTLQDLASCCGADRRVAVCRELTKLFEETWRGTLAEACERSTAGAIRGEHVIVVAAAPAGEHPAPSEVEVRRAVANRMSAGVSRRQAAAEVAEELGVSKRLAYEISLARNGQ